LLARFLRGTASACSLPLVLFPQESRQNTVSFIWNSTSKSNKKIMRNYNWEYFKAQINQKLSEPETKEIYNQRKMDVEPVFGFMKAILGFTRMSVRGINKVKSELGFVLMALNIRKVVAQRANYNQNNNEKGNFYIISIEIAFSHLSKNFMSSVFYYFLGNNSHAYQH
jgi:transposase